MIRPWNQRAVDAYFQTLLWSSSGEEDFETGEVAPGELERVSALVLKWLYKHETALDLAEELLDGTSSDGSTGWELVGHNLWLSQVGHGCGFWDGDLSIPFKGKELGDYLTEKSKELGEGAGPYFGDDGLIYIFGMEEA